MSWGEASRLARIVANDPSSQVAAALMDWAYPAEMSTVVLMHLFDAYAEVNFKRPQPWPKPWDRPKVFGRTSMTVPALRAALDSHRQEVGDG